MKTYIQPEVRIAEMEQNLMEDLTSIAASTESIPDGASVSSKQGFFDEEEEWD